MSAVGALDGSRARRRGPGGGRCLPGSCQRDRVDGGVFVGGSLLLELTGLCGSERQQGPVSLGSWTGRVCSVLWEASGTSSGAMQFLI